ncbi:hypothetical protein [Burkholderia sp. BE17]|uniref:hypothetical protein n=1 Tax=Burkholderia sp. BE17 TaxID=2656644 RepID=UPI00128AEB28|nr:hypothetical protein [Burkholderia sp. BE17]MPV71324.1 hypothetical protein [Burkholderia sp. BE17]
MSRAACAARARLEVEPDTELRLPSRTRTNSTSSRAPVVQPSARGEYKGIRADVRDAPRSHEMVIVPAMHRVDRLVVPT